MPAFNPGEARKESVIASGGEEGSTLWRVASHAPLGDTRGMPAKPGSVEKIFKAFADPTRLRILLLLRGGEVCVGDLTAALRIPQPTASRHLSSLRRSGLALARKKGPWVFYSLSPAKMKFQEALYQSLDCCADESSTMKADLARLKRASERGGCC